MSNARASRSANAERHARSGDGLARDGQQLPHDEVDAGRCGAQLREQRRQEHRRGAVGCADREAPRRSRRIERRGRRDDASHARENIRDRRGELGRACRRHHALRRLQEQRIVEQPTQPAEPVADGGRREIQPLGRAPDVAFFDHHFEQHQQVEVGAREVNFIQHIC